MKVVLFGGTGMVGSGVLLECLDSPRVESVVSVSRSSTNVTHPKLREILHRNFLEFKTIREQFLGADACFFCLGVSSAGMREADYRALTHDVTLAAANAMLEVSPQLTFIFVSGEGTDSTERGRSMWARVKGKTENDLLALPFKAAYMFRPGFIQPLRGVRSKTPVYQAVYKVTRTITPMLRALFPRHTTTTVNIGRAMIEVAADGFPRSIIDSAAINALATLVTEREHASANTSHAANGDDQ
ncbi:MAG: epimerase [Gemmatimonadota bacterium]|nr:epimerase [Gemmatimonadota bacterium]